MSQIVSVNGVSYSLPTTGEKGWGAVLTAFFVAVAGTTLQKNGGTFVLTADANFGANFGLLAAYFKSRGALPSSTGLLRLTVNDFIAWRNNANSADLALSLSGADKLLFNGQLVTIEGITQITGDVTAGPGPGSVVSTITPGIIVNAMINAAAAIARTKFAAGTADHVLINNPSGVMSSEASLAITRGGTGQATKTPAFDALSPLTTKGDLVAFDGTNNVRFPAGTNGQTILFDSTQTSGLRAADVGASILDWGGSAGGTADVLTLTPATPLTGYSAGITYTFLATATNTTTPTINVSGLGAKSIKTLNGSSLSAGNITSGYLYSITYDGTNFRIGNLITTANIINLSVTTAKIVDSNVTAAKIETSVNLPGSSVQVNSKRVITANTNAANNLAIIRVRFDSNGNLLSGEGATAVKTGMGQLQITWSIAFLDTPIVCSTAENSGAAFTSNYASPSTTGVFITNRDFLNGVANVDFNLIAIGQRA